MKKYTNKFLVVIFIAFLVILVVLPNYSQATDFDSIKSQADGWLGNGNSYIGPEKIANIIMPISRILVAIATITVLVVATVMGIKYMSASPDEQAKLKTQLIGLVVATVVIYGAYGIWSLVYNFMSNVAS